MSAPHTSRKSLPRAVGLAVVGLLALMLGFNAYWVSEHPDLLRPVTRGKAAPTFALKTAEGRTVKLGDLRGKVVVISFWATWCAPCLEKMPKLAELARRRAADGVAVLAVNVEGSAKLVQKYIDRTGHGAPHQDGTPAAPTMLVDDQGVSGRYGVQSLPHTVVVGPDGGVVFVQLMGGTVKELETVVDRALEQRRGSSAAAEDQPQP